MLTVHIQGRQPTAPKNDLPNPYRTVEGWAKMPEGRTWGATSSVDIDKDGTSIWVGERCGANTCTGRNDPTILKFDAQGNLVKAFGAGMFVYPHGVHVDRQGNVFVAMPLGVQVFNRKGRFLGTIPLSKKIQNLAFAGPEKKTLYIVSQGSIWKVRTLTGGPVGRAK